jgi:hypothetical protein
MCLAGAVIGILAEHGMNLPVAQDGLAEVIGAIIFLILAHIDATHPNTFFNSPNEEANSSNDDEILDDIDPAGEYEQ